MSVSWSYFDKFKEITEKYLPDIGEGETMATQMVTAVSKLVYKWYNDGDVYDNTYYLDGWCNDLSSYANWLATHCGYGVQKCLCQITNCRSDDDYEELLKKLADMLLDETVTELLDRQPKEGSIYECEWVFKFDKYKGEEEEEDDFDEES